MIVSELLREVENRGVALAGVGSQLRFRPASALTPDLIEGLRQHKAEILERLKNGDRSPILSTPEKRERSRDPLLNSPVIRDTGEVLELARAHFGELKHPEDPPYPPHEGSGDPMVRKHGDKAQFFQDVRRRDRERREREGLPPWIRVVDGGAA